jgi:hypothetical protein
MNPIEIKVSECYGCPFWHQEGDYSMVDYYCKHPCQYYDGNKEDEFIEHCPLKQSETIIKFERDGKA